MTPLGFQELVNLYDCDPVALDDVDGIGAAMLEAARRSGATVVSHCFHRFSPHGVSGVVVIAESHLAIHTWPEHRYAAVDLFTCGEGLRADEGLSYLASALGSGHHAQRVIRRGADARRGAAREPSHVPRITLLHGSLGGTSGDTAAIIDRLTAHLAGQAHVRAVDLGDAARTTDDLATLLRSSDGFLFCTGTHGDSWGGPLQEFLEKTTGVEGSPAWLGKPAAVVVTMRSVASTGVLSRLQGVLCTLGCSIPPMSGMVHSVASHPAVANAAPAAAPFLDEAWRLDELEIVCHNLLEAARGGTAWRTWRVDGEDPARRWIFPHLVTGVLYSRP